MQAGAKAFIQYGLARSVLGFLGVLPRAVGYRLGDAIAWIAYMLARRQRNVGMQNLRMAMPELSDAERDRIIREVFRNLGRLLIEFGHFPELKRDTIPELVEYDGLENYLEARRRGKGVLCLTAHIGAWELCSFAHSVYGFPMKFLARPIDNPLVDQLITRYRTCAGNGVIDRRGAARNILKALSNNEAVGLLIDQNTTRSEGVFADFFGVPAATTPGLATLALRTGAAVIPCYIRWDQGRGRHIAHVDPPLELVDTGNREADVIANTEMFNRILEDFVREFPEQWLWIHRRWKTRPEGEPSLY